jgi:hypothetical protein
MSMILRFRLHQTISSAVYKRREGSRVEDSFVQVENRIFGQVVEMLWLPDYAAAFMLMQVYEQVNVAGDNSLPLQFPINQFPVQPVTGEFKVYHVTKSLFIQKIVRSVLRFRSDPLKGGWDFFAVRPNEWFQF